MNTISEDPNCTKALLEVIRRNIKQAIWRYEDFHGKDKMEYKDFDPSNLDDVKNVAMMWTGGKDSSIVLACIRDLFGGRIPMDVIFIDTGNHMQEVIWFINKIAEEWRFKDRMVIARSDNVLAAVNNKRVLVHDLPDRYQEELKRIGWEKDYFDIGDNPACCHLLKTCAFQDSLEKGGYKAVFESIRWDEQKERSSSGYFVIGSGWIDHVRVRPSLFLTYEETKQILLDDFGIPKNPLYENGYTSLGCMPCTHVTDTPEIERSGRIAQKEIMMARLQALGYHGGEKE